MKMFDKDGKVNFVDENNVFIVYECCEDFGYIISEHIPQTINFNFDCSIFTDKDIDGFSFDTSFFKEICFSNLEDCSAVVFKMQNKSGDVKFLTLYNIQNGYYSHGFIMNKDDLKLQEGAI